MEITQKIQQDILVKLTHSKGLRFNELWGKHGESNTFSYHLKNLIDKNLILKINEQYGLSNDGMTYVAAMEGVSGKTSKKPLVCSFILGYEKEKDLILINIRKKEPFFDYVGIPGGKMDFGAYPLKTAKEEFLEETNLKGDFQLGGISNYNTYNDNKLIHHIVAFTYICTNCKGDLKEKNREGDNKWIARKDLPKYLHYPELVYFISTLVTNTTGIKFFNINRYQKNGVFQNIDILQDF